MGGSPVGGGRNGKKAKNREKNGDAGLGEDCWRARRPRRRRTSLERCRKWPESEPRAVTRRRVGDSPEEKSGAWGRVRCRFPVGFPLACRSASGVSEYVVVSRKIGRRKISPEKVAGVVEIPTAMRLSGVVREENEGTGVKHGHWTVGQIEVRAYLERLSLEQGWSCSKAPLSKLIVLVYLKVVYAASLTGLFKHIMTVDDPSTDENLREKVLNFIRDKVFPLKAELLKPQEQMERHITNLIKKSLEDVTGAEFKMFMDFLRSLTLFGEKAPPERVQELIEIIEGQADLDAQFNVP
ncbi:Apoptosis inhibitor 5-like protein API5 [Vitis vinifera]|uniref:Apoptosis inhibitor 5-like protein API5 n=1 Tax=Vitis vinifera TaxID=29760 RepID=A0A438DR72_VITVI|nr:Apoptosis inhibitor 5-like protein API5 [Vitis vinifera]